MIEEGRDVVEDRAGVVEESGDEFSCAALVVSGGEDVELESGRVEEPRFGLEDGADGGSRGDDLLAVGVLDAAKSALRGGRDGEGEGEGLVEKELLAVAEVAREGGGGEGLKAELADEAVGLRGESRVTGEEGDLRDARG